MLIGIYPRDWENQLEIIKMRADEGYGKYMVILNIIKDQRVLINLYWNNIGCIILLPTFSVGGSILW